MGLHVDSMDYYWRLFIHISTNQREMLKMTITPLQIKDAKWFGKTLLKTGYGFFTNLYTTFGVLIGGLLANNTLYYHTGLTNQNVDLLFPCVVYFTWAFMLSAIEYNIDWEPTL